MLFSLRNYTFNLLDIKSLVCHYGLLCFDELPSYFTPIWIQATTAESDITESGISKKALTLFKDTINILL